MPKPTKTNKPKNPAITERLSEKALVTPPAILRYGWLDNARVDETYNKVTHEATLSFDPKDAEHAAFLNTLKLLFQKFCVDVLKMPGDVKHAPDPAIFKADPDDPSRVIVKFFTKAEKDSTFAEIYDKSLQKTDAPWKGSTVRVSFVPCGWKSKLGTSLSLYLEGVLVVESSKGTRSASASFAPFAEAVANPFASEDVPNAEAF